MPYPPVPVNSICLGNEGLYVSLLGLGCMGMSAFYGAAKPEEEMIALIRKAMSMGVTFLDTSDVYGPHTNEVLVGKAIKGLDRSRIQLATKFGILLQDGNLTVKGDASYVRAACEASLKRLDTEYIDLYYQHRVDPTVPIEITVGEIKKLVEEGKVKYIGLSEASADTIRRAHAVHPITAVQLEWSLWSRDAEKEIIPLCRELGIGIVPYSPLGRGIFGGKGITEPFGEGDSRKERHDRFTTENLAKNKVFYERLVVLAEKKGCTPAQLALSWVLHHQPQVAPIPGTTRVEKLEENIGALAITLSVKEFDEVSNVVSDSEVAGGRYPAMMAQYTWQHANTPSLESWKSE